MSININFPFTTPANYTYGSNVEVAGGAAKLVDLRPDDATFYASFKSSLNGSWGNGVLTGTQSGGAVITGGWLDLTSGSEKYVDYAGLNNADGLIQEGCVRFLIKPDWTGNPAAIRNFIVIAEASADSSNLINIYVKTDGNIKVVMNNLTTGTITSDDLGVWSPVSGTSYEFELNFNISTDTPANTAIRLFVDGTQFGPTKTGVIGTRSNAIGIIRVGTNVGTGDTADHYIKDLILYETVQHTANYTPGAAIPPTKYDTDNPTVEVNTSWRMEGLDAFAATVSVSGSDIVKYILKKGSSWYWYDGAAWSVTDGTAYGESNTAADIETNKATFASIGITSKVKAFLHSDDGSTTPQLSNIEIDYDFSGDIPDDISVCTVWNYAKKPTGAAAAGAVSAELTRPSVKYKTNTTIVGGANIPPVLPDSITGYWEIELVENENMEDGAKYTFQIDGKKYIRSVPDELSKNFWDLEE